MLSKISMPVLSDRYGFFRADVRFPVFQKHLLSAWPEELSPILCTVDQRYTLHSRLEENTFHKVVFRKLFEQALILRIPADVFAYKPAGGPDLQPAFSSVIEARLNQFAAQAAVSDCRWDAGVRKGDDLPHWYVVEHGKVSVDADLEALLFRIMGDFLFSIHRVIFIPICDFVNPNRS